MTFKRKWVDRKERQMEDRDQRRGCTVTAAVVWIIIILSDSDVRTITVVAAWVRGKDREGLAMIPESKSGVERMTKKRKRKKRGGASKYTNIREQVKCEHSNQRKIRVGEMKPSRQITK